MDLCGDYALKGGNYRRTSKKNLVSVFRGLGRAWSGWGLTARCGDGGAGVGMMEGRSVFAVAERGVDRDMGVFGD